MSVPVSLCLLLLVHATQGCSEFWFNNEYGLSARSMDLGSDIEWTMTTLLRGRKYKAVAPGLRRGVTWEGKYGVLGVAPADAIVNHGLFEGLNEMGLSASFNSLENSTFPNVTDTTKAVDMLSIVAYLLTTCATVAEADAALAGVQVWPGLLKSLTTDLHMAVRDADGHSLVVEWVGGQQMIYRDDKYGIMTNEPTLDFHHKNCEYIDWKHSLTRTAVEVPGAFYPAERFLRVHLIKQSLPKPKNYQDAVSQAVHVLNSVTVPNGMWGTDTGSSSEGKTAMDHTWWTVVRDHKNKAVYFRTVTNQLIQRIALSDLDLSPTAKIKRVNLDHIPGPFYTDGTSLLQ